MKKNNLFLPGHSACPGCGNAIAIKLILEVIGKKSIMVMPPGCSSVFTILPFCNLNIPATTSTFAGSAAVADGISDGVPKNITVFVIAGDGGTADIGLQAISGAIQRKSNYIFFCLNNLGYRNTGNQPSGLTPYKQKTSLGLNKNKPKNLFKIICAHNPSYAARVSISKSEDMKIKIKKAKKLKGFRFIEILCPCPTGMKFKSSKTITMADYLIKKGLFSLEEYKND